MIFIAKNVFIPIMNERYNVIKKEPFTLRDNNGGPMDFDAEIVYGKENTNELFLWIKSTRNDDPFNILKFRLKELFKKHKIEPNVLIFKNSQYNGSNGKYFPFTIDKKYQKPIDEIEKYNNGNYNSFFIYLPFFDRTDLLSIGFVHYSGKSNQEISRNNGINLIETSNKFGNATEKNHSLFPVIIGIASILLGGYFLYRHLKKDSKQTSNPESA